MNQLIIILFSAILVNNVVLNQFLGICPFLGVSKKLDTAVGMSAAVTFVMVLATAVTWPIYRFILEPLHLEFLQTVAFILIIASLVQLLEIVLRKFMPPLYNSLGIFLPLITTNCAVLGVTTLVLDRTINGEVISFLPALVNAFSGGLGFFLAMVLFAGIRQKLETCDIPKCLRGIPITLVAASLLAVSFLGFQGIVDGLIK